MPAWPAWAGERMPNPDSSHFALGLCPRPAGNQRNKEAHSYLGPFHSWMKEASEAEWGPRLLSTRYMPALCRVPHGVTDSSQRKEQPHCSHKTVEA